MNFKLEKFLDGAINVVVVLLIVYNTGMSVKNFYEEKYFMLFFSGLSTLLLLTSRIYAHRVMKIVRVRKQSHEFYDPIPWLWKPWKPTLLFLPRKIDEEWYWLCKQYKRQRYKTYRIWHEALCRPPKITQYGTMATVMRTNDKEDEKQILAED